MSDLKEKSIEERNVQKVREWAESWTLPGGKQDYVDRCYAAAPEVCLTLQGKFGVPPGISKDKWREQEEHITSQYSHREMEFISILPSGNKVALEGICRTTTKEGVKREWPFAVFLTFDAEGLIISDHTYMLGSPHIQQLSLYD